MPDVDVLHDMKLMLFEYGTNFAFNIKPQERKNLVIEGHRNAHVFDSDLDVVNDRFHGFYLPFKPNACVRPACIVAS